MNTLLELSLIAQTICSCWLSVPSIVLLYYWGVSVDSGVFDLCSFLVVLGSSS